MDRTKWQVVPVQGEGKQNGLKMSDVPPGYVDWDEHRQAWESYAERYPGQSASVIAQRGGFGYFELLEFLGHPPESWRLREPEKYPNYEPPTEKPL